MRSFISHALDGIDTLALEDVPAPGPLGPGQIRVAMRAASLNYRDLLVVTGALRDFTRPDLVLCSDGAGEVIETAPDVWRVRTGDRIALTFNPDWIGGAFTPSPGAAGRGGALQGVMTDELVVDQSEAVRLPDHLSFADGATLPCAAVTAWHALCGAAPLMPGMTVLLQGAGGVSVFALQFAKLFGARVLITSSGPERCAKLAALGADATIDYRAEPDWAATVRRLTGGTGVDLSIDIGGAETIDRAMAATRVGGRLAMVGLLTGSPQTASSIFSAGVDVSTIKVGSRADFEDMVRAIAFHRLQPVIDSYYPFEQLPAALRHLQSGTHFGKIVIDFTA
jgi:NADPH:quinone reductase-like Zn-dependent oxidoreductase